MLDGAPLYPVDGVHGAATEGNRMVRMNSKTLALSAVLCTASCMLHLPGAGGPVPPPNPDVPYAELNARQLEMFQAYPGVTASTAPAFWLSSLNLSQRVEYAGGTRVVVNLEAAHHWRALLAVTGINGDAPATSSADQFNNAVVWNKDAAKHFSKLPGWSAHLALLHPGQYGYQENRDDNPFWGVVVLFDENPSDPNKVAGQFHIDFRSLFGHYEAENGDIGNAENYERYKLWYGPLGSFEP
jgi:hypothetical protein